MSSDLKAEVATTCRILGRLHKGNYLIEPACVRYVKDLIHYLKKDNELHEIRRYLGETKVLQNDLIQIIKGCPEENSDLFGATLRLLINLTTPAPVLYGENIPADKIEGNAYLILIGYSQDYKAALCDVEFWNKICRKLTDLYEIQWTDRSEEDGVQMERILMLLRNVLRLPTDVENEIRPDNEVTPHDKILRILRESQILELLLLMAADRNENQFYINLLEIFSLVLREQNPKTLARCDVHRSAEDVARDAKDLVKLREFEKRNRNEYLNTRNFSATFVMKGVKSLSNRDIVFHKPLEKIDELEFNNVKKKQIKGRRCRVPVESDLVERRSTFVLRLFLKEFCVEFLNSSFRDLMHAVKNKLESGKALPNDHTYYFWALKFFLDFATEANSDVEVLRGVISFPTFHFVQTNMEKAFERLMEEKTKNWVKRIHLILKAYRSLLETLLWMDRSSSALIRSMSRAIKSEAFYVAEYREMTLQALLRYDPTKFPLSYLRDLVETNHIFGKILEEHSKESKLLVQRITKKKSSKKEKKKVEKVKETPEEIWERIQDDLYDALISENSFPEIPPFDAALDIPIDDQKGRAMKTIQEFLHAGRIRDAIGLFRSARQVWPENDFFGFKGMTIEDETHALGEICRADLEQLEGGNSKKVSEPPKEQEDKDEDASGNEDVEHIGIGSTRIVEQEFDIMEYKKLFVNKKVIEGCGILLRNYKKNSDYTNRCVIKLLHRIGWECCMPAMLFQASIFWTLLKVMKDKRGSYNDIRTFAVQLFRQFRKRAMKNSVVFLELLFWKDHSGALGIQHGYELYGGGSKKGKTKGKSKGDGKERGTKKRKKKNNLEFLEGDETEVDISGPNECNSNHKRASKKSRFVMDCSSSEDETPWETSAEGIVHRETVQTETVQDGSSHANENEGCIDQKTSSFVREQEIEKGEARGVSEEPDEISKPKVESSVRKQKRRRIISSGSDSEDLESAEAEPGFGDIGSKKRKRVMMAESDSDVDVNSSEYAVANS